MNDFFTIVTDDAFDDYEDEPMLGSGVNIKTGAYGLFLVALDNSKGKDTDILIDAMDAVDGIQDCTMFHAMDPYFPPDDLNPKNIIKLADLIIKLNDITEGEYADKVDGEHVTKFVEMADKALGMKEGYLERLKEQDEMVSRLMESLGETNDE